MAAVVEGRDLVLVPIRMSSQDLKVSVGILLAYRALGTSHIRQAN